MEREGRYQGRQCCSYSTLGEWSRPASGHGADRKPAGQRRAEGEPKGRHRGANGRGWLESGREAADRDESGLDGGRAEAETEGTRDKVIRGADGGPVRLPFAELRG